MLVVIRFVHGRCTMSVSHPHTLVLISDDPAACLPLATTLTQLQYAVHLLVSTYGTTIAELRAVSPNVILIDFEHTLGVDALELVDDLQNDAELAGIPIIALLPERLLIGSLRNLLMKRSVIVVEKPVAVFRLAGDIEEACTSADSLVMSPVIEPASPAQVPDYASMIEW